MSQNAFWSNLAVVCALPCVVALVLLVRAQVVAPEKVEPVAGAPVMPGPPSEQDRAAMVPDIIESFRAYQDEDGNFVAPPPGVLPSTPPLRSSAPAVEFRSAVPGGGVGIVTRGFRMMQTAVAQPDGTIVVRCDPAACSNVEHTHNQVEDDQ